LRAAVDLAYRAVARRHLNELHLAAARLGHPGSLQEKADGICAEMVNGPPPAHVLEMMYVHADCLFETAHARPLGWVALQRALAAARVDFFERVHEQGIEIRHARAYLARTVLGDAGGFGEGLAATKPGVAVTAALVARARLVASPRAAAWWDRPHPPSGSAEAGAIPNLTSTFFVPPPLPNKAPRAFAAAAHQARLPRNPSVAAFGALQALSASCLLPRLVFPDKPVHGCWWRLYPSIVVPLAELFVRTCPLLAAASTWSSLPLAVGGVNGQHLLPWPNDYIECTVPFMDHAVWAIASFLSPSNSGAAEQQQQQEQESPAVAAVRALAAARAQAVELCAAAVLDTSALLRNGGQAAAVRALNDARELIGEAARQLFAEGGQNDRAAALLAAQRALGAALAWAYAPPAPPPSYPPHNAAVDAAVDDWWELMANNAAGFSLVAGLAVALSARADS
jgi:hypothetical protein